MDFSDRHPSRPSPYPSQTSRRAEPYPPDAGSNGRHAGGDARFALIAALETQLEAAQRLAILGLATRSIAHDLNNLFCIIDAYADALASGTSTDVAGDATRIRDAVARAADMTSQLLTGAMAGDKCTAGSALDLHRSIGEMGSLLSRLAGRNIRFTYALESPQSRVRLTRTLLDQIVFNLVANARDAMPDGGDITLRTMAAPFPVHGNAALVFEISDTGAGMASDVKARIFEPFFSTKEPGRGTGLGLRTVLTAVQRAGGEIDVESTPGKGTTVRIFLPLAID
jgi:signal transduction histidine kinase